MAEAQKATFWPRRDPATGKYEQVRPVIMTFPKLIIPEKFKGTNGKEQGDPKFSGNFLFPLKWADGPNTDLGIIGRLVEAVAHARWPGRNIRNPLEFKLPWVMGDFLADKAAAKKKDGEYQRGQVVLTARSGQEYPPVLSGVDPTTRRLALFDTDELRHANKARFYQGVYVIPYFSFKAYEGVGANPDGVNAYLQGVTTLNKGQRIGGTGVDAESFQGYIGQDVEVDPTAGMAPNAQFADAIPF